jgi:hypothetical protein
MSPASFFLPEVLVQQLGAFPAKIQERHSAFTFPSSGFFTSSFWFPC